MKLRKIKNFDYDNYICTIFADKSLWDDIATILEFNIEIATIKSKVTDPTLGLIRLQWWREAIEDIFSEGKQVKAHEVVLGLKALNNKYKLSKDKLLRIVNSREKDLHEKPFSNLNELLDYIENTAFGLNDIIFDILSDSEPARSVVKDFSVAWGITAIIRAYASNLSKGRKIIPEEVSLNELIDLAEGRIKSARELLKSIDAKKSLKKLAPVLLKGRIAEFYLGQFKNKRFDHKKPKIRSLEGVGVLKMAGFYYLNRF